MRERKTAERDAVIAIVESGVLPVDTNKIDIAEALEVNSSIVYRDKQINLIGTAGKENKEQCKTYILSYGSGDVPFDERFKHKKVCILNFASSKNPGGGFMTGANAQEENLCYHSNLYYCLEKHKSFYEFNRNNLNRGLYSEGIIFTKDVLFFKKNFKNTAPKFADVISCAAPNKGAALRNGVKSTEIDRVMTERLEKILKVAIDNEVETLVLGAFGCGVFKNDLNYVAMEIKKLLYMKGYARYFKNIVIPVLTRNGREYSTFVSTFRGVGNLTVE